VTVALAQPVIGDGTSTGSEGIGAPLRAFTRQAGRFAIIGSTGTGVALGLYTLLGLWVDPLVANTGAWLVTTLTTNSLQRHFAFGITDPARAPLDHVVALTFSLLALLASFAALAALTNANPAQQSIALIAVNFVVGAARFVAVRWWLRPSSALPHHPEKDQP